MIPRYLKNSYRIEVSGVVQGVGFRPFVYRLAQELGLDGHVFNHEHGVTVEVECAEGMLRNFLEELEARAPTASRIDSVRHEEVPFKGYRGFEIRESTAGSGERYAGISPDLALCPDCRAEIHDPGNRRYAYPFTNCTNCGPRYTIIREIPYDRVATTMAGFRMCPECKAEYHNPEDRRFHAQPNACAACGPSIQLLDATGAALNVPVHFHRNKPLLDRAVAFLRQGKILALKGVGGFHLACDATSTAAVALLRSRKARERKPFAVMFPSLESLQDHVDVSRSEAAILLSAASPILLARKKAPRGKPIVEGVAPGQPRLGVFLPYSPLHELLLAAYGKPLVMTSGNLSDEPIVYRNEEAVEALSGLADHILIHDRPIEIRCDDSVVQEFRGRPFFFRRSRGYAPLALRTSEPFAADLLAVGAGLKNTIAIAKEGKSELILSQHLGDLDSPECIEFFEGTISHLSSLFGLKTGCIAHDAHPELPSSLWAEKATTKLQAKAVAVQHHHAHIASCLEDGKGHAFMGPVIGIALDGTGLGTDGTIWGGEILLADRRDFVRVGSLKPFRLAGGDFSIRQPWRSGLALMKAAGIEDAVQQEILSPIPAEHLSLVRQALERNLNCFTTSSCGRLFDAVSAITGLCREGRFEGEAAILLEAAMGSESIASFNEARRFYELGIGEQGGRLELDWRPMLEQLVADVRDGVSSAQISGRFHAGLLQGLLSAVEKVSKKYAIRSIALSGGCFLNTFLRERLTAELELKGFQVLLPAEVPCNDGGISFGQAIVANQMLREVRSCVWQYR